MPDSRSTHRSGSCFLPTPAAWPGSARRRSHLAEVRRFAEETGDRWALAEVLRLRGDVLLAMSDPAAADAGYREAIALAQQQSAKLWELRAATSLARLWRDQGRCADAHKL